MPESPKACGSQAWTWNCGAHPELRHSAPSGTSPAPEWVRTRLPGETCSQGCPHPVPQEGLGGPFPPISLLCQLTPLPVDLGAELRRNQEPGKRTQGFLNSQLSSGPATRLLNEPLVTKGGIVWSMHVTIFRTKKWSKGTPVWKLCFYYSITFTWSPAMYSRA